MSIQNKLINKFGITIVLILYSFFYTTMLFVLGPFIAVVGIIGNPKLSFVSKLRRGLFFFLCPLFFIAIICIFLNAQLIGDGLLTAAMIMAILSLLLLFFDRPLDKKKPLRKKEPLAKKWKNRAKLYKRYNARWVKQMEALSFHDWLSAMHSFACLIRGDFISKNIGIKEIIETSQYHKQVVERAMRYYMLYEKDIDLLLSVWGRLSNSAKRILIAIQEKADKNIIDNLPGYEKWLDNIQIGLAAFQTMRNNNQLTIQDLMNSSCVWKAYINGGAIKHCNNTDKPIT